jgi:putative OPT family oligopeptide transporter
MGKASETGPAAAIIIGSVVCCAAAIAGDNMQDLKAGHILGATPWKQQLMQIVGTVSAAVVMAPILTLLLKAYGFAGHESATDNALAAPQASLIASVAKGVFAGGLPWNFVFTGMIIAIGIIILDKYLEKRGSSFRTPVLAVAIGFYLPFELAVPIFVGGIIHWVTIGYDKNKKAGSDGLLLASGLITGEALLGILLAIPIVISGKPDVMALMEKPIGAWPGIVLMIAIIAWLYRVSRK